MLDNIHKLSHCRHYKNKLKKRGCWPERFQFSKEEKLEELADAREEEVARLERLEREEEEQQARDELEIQRLRLELSSSSEDY